MQPVRSVPQGFTGRVNLQLTDLIQMVCLCLSDLIIHVKSGEGNGTIYVKGGRIHHVQTEVLHGEEAFFEILRWKDGQFEMLPYQDIELSSIDKPWEHLLLEATRRRDEGKHRRTQVESTVQSSTDSEQWELDDKIDEVFESLHQSAKQSMEEDGEDPLQEAPTDQIVRVFIVDDSNFFAQQLRKMLEDEPHIEVVGTARNGKEALQFLASSPHVDLITLDIQMPVMQGDTTLKHIMIRHPIPVLIVSSLESQSLNKAFEFLQLGAVDFIPKPEAQEDVALYGEFLRTKVKSSARGKVSHFRRWRKSKGGERPKWDTPLSGRRILTVLGAEGAYVDWFRLPLSSLCRHGLVLGFQNLPDRFLASFCRLIEAETRVKVEPLLGTEWINPGTLRLGNAHQCVQFKVDMGTMTLNVGDLVSNDVSWSEGIQYWLGQMAEQALDRMSVYLLSAAHALPQDLIDKLLACGTQFILPPRDTVICTDLVDSVLAYSSQHPDQITWGSPENLTEVWLKNELNV